MKKSVVLYNEFLMLVKSYFKLSKNNSLYHPLELKFNF